ncbi:hypothetical protein [Bacillus wiedmannii]|uniref:hypothetical protein n=1 Tax=Bacillus wiedmannii TaxID=1890302 RepID=UPI000BF0A8C2|nr:hypothetical protein [Bacillus wiedmannii]PEO36760.1 hypothetical protein CN555_21400 [Bacillus wiedmannii]
MSKIVKGSAGLSSSVNFSDPYFKERAKAQDMADLFASQLSHFQSLGLEEPEDMMIYWYKSFYECLSAGNYAKQPEKFIRPSMVGSDKQALWYQLRGHKADEDLLYGNPVKPAFQERWQAIGTVVGDMLQRQVLSAYYNVVNHPFKFDFRFEIKANGHPMFEEFARSTWHTEKGTPICGTCDGILRHIPSDGRIGFEVKSKQTSYASTGDYSMKAPDSKHVKQIKTYALMYGLDYYFIVYQNCAKKSWNMSREEQLKYPDMRVFGVYISPEEKAEHEAYLDSLWDLQNTTEKPPLDLLNWNFNGYKKTILKDMTREEFGTLTAQLLNIENGRFSAFEKKSARTAYDEIEAYMIEHKGLYKDILGGN